MLAAHAPASMTWHHVGWINEQPTIAILPWPRLRAHPQSSSTPGTQWAQPTIMCCGYQRLSHSMAGLDTRQEDIIIWHEHAVCCSAVFNVTCGGRPALTDDHCRPVSRSTAARAVARTSARDCEPASPEAPKVCKASAV